MLSGRQGANEVSLGHARFISQHPSANHVAAYHVGLRHIRQAHPAAPPNRVHTKFRATVWFQTFTERLATTGFFHLRERINHMATPAGTLTR